MGWVDHDNPYPSIYKSGDDVYNSGIMLPQHEEDPVGRVVTNDEYDPDEDPMGKGSPGAEPRYRMSMGPIGTSAGSPAMIPVTTGSAGGYNVPYPEHQDTFQFNTGRDINIRGNYFNNRGGSGMNTEARFHLELIAFLIRQLGGSITLTNDEVLEMMAGDPTVMETFERPESGSITYRIKEPE